MHVISCQKNIVYTVHAEKMSTYCRSNKMRKRKLIRLFSFMWHNSFPSHSPAMRWPHCRNFVFFFLNMLMWKSPRILDCDFIHFFFAESGKTPVKVIRFTIYSNNNDNDEASALYHWDVDLWMTKHLKFIITLAKKSCTFELNR